MLPMWDSRDRLLLRGREERADEKVRISSPFPTLSLFNFNRNLSNIHISNSFRSLEASGARIAMLEKLIHELEPFLNNRGLIILNSSYAQVIISPHFHQLSQLMIIS